VTIMRSMVLKRCCIRLTSLFDSRSCVVLQDCPAFASLPQYVRLVGGASMAAANALVKDEVDIAICWDGGR
ncbi:hypothetical protein BC835DRAFT_1361101, partial [Cytidiella melzeri]